MARRDPKNIRGKDSEFMKTARWRFKLGSDSESDQFQREKDDIQFEAGSQWDATILLSRQGQQPVNGQPAIPARPSLVVNKIKEPIRQILNQERSADLGVQIVPADDFGDLGLVPDKAEVELREGLIRRIQRDSHASDARTWAFKRAVIAGRGYYLVMTRYLPGKTRDQEVYVELIYHQEAVIGDPTRQKPDGSDAEWWFIGSWCPWDRIASEYPVDVDGGKNAFSTFSDGDFISMAESYPEWYQSEGADEKKQLKKQKSVRIVDYWYTERTSRKLCTLNDATYVWEDELTDAQAAEVADTDVVVEKTIKFCKIAGGVLVLEATDWAGPDMPIIQVVGDEVLPYDSEKRYEGMVRPARDVQQAYNYMVSKQVEVIGLTPLPPLMLDPDAIDGFEDDYKLANTRPLFGLKYRTYDDQGRELRPPMRPPVDPNILPLSQSIALFDMGIKSTTAVPDPTLGNVDPTLKSARAIKEVVANAQQSTTNFLDNLVRSIAYEGKVENNLLYPIYGAKPGRLVRALTGENETQRWMITDKAQPAAPPPMQVPGQPPSPQAQAQKVAKLTKDANFNVVVKVGKSWDTRREQLLGTLATLIAADPMIMAVQGDLFFKNMDVPGHAEMAKRQRVMLAPPVQAMLAAEENGQHFDPVAQAKIAQLTERVQHAEAAMSELAEEARGKKVEYQKAVDTEQMKQAGETERAQVDADLKLQLADKDNAAKVEIARINAASKGASEDKKLMAKEEELATGLMVSAAEQSDANQQAAEDRMHDAATSAADRTHQANESARGRKHEQEMGVSQMAHEAATAAVQPNGDGA